MRVPTLLLAAAAALLSSAPAASATIPADPCPAASGFRADHHRAVVPAGPGGSRRLSAPEPVRRAASADPYVDAVAPANEVPVTDPANLTGAPDDRFAAVSGRFARFLVLDLGTGEEGVGDLEVRFRQPTGTIAQSMDVHFLDGNGRELGQGQLTMIGAGTRVTTVTNPSTRPYRYLRILTGLQNAQFDSMRAEAVAS